MLIAAHFVQDRGLNQAVSEEYKKGNLHNGSFL